MNKLGLALKRHAPEILTTLSVAGVVATAYFGSNAGYKAGVYLVTDFAERTENAAPDEVVEPLAPKEVVKQTWKFYIPTAIAVVGTTVMVVGSNRISNSRQIALFSAAAISERALAEYQQKIVETTSVGKERKIQDAIIQDEVDKQGDKLDALTLKNDNDVLVIESFTKHVFVSNAEKIHRAENAANRQAIHDGYISLNDFLEHLGIPTSDAGDVVGWTNDNPLEVIIGGSVHNEKPVLTVNYITKPKINYDKPW
jgi:hypothetical protein